MNKRPEFIEVPENQEVVEAEQFQLKCVAHGKPVPQIAWFKGDSEVVASTGLVIETMEDDTNKETHSTLMVDQANMGDEGRYRVEARNKVGTSQHKFDLLGKFTTMYINHLFLVVAFSSLLKAFDYDAGFCFLPVNKAPEFVVTPANLDTVENERVELVCRAHGKPLPEITWTRTGAEVKTDRNLKIKNSKDKSSNEVESVLSINKVSLDDEDRDYCVEASNKLGSVEHAFSINGMMKHNERWPKCI